MRITSAWAAICAFVRWVSFINRGTPNENEIIKFYTKLLRNPEECGFKTTDSMKAAEFFAKYYNMLDKDSDSAGTVIIVDDIGRAGNE